MIKRACIYCGTTDNLSDSDIIPDALTNAKIINPNVCRIAHNSKFSDYFESKVIEKLATITNLLDVKSSKGKQYARYPMIFTIGNEEYFTKIASDTEVFQKINTSLDGKTKIGPIDKILKISGASEYNVTAIDINEREITKKIILNLEVFFSIEMYRLITKIAYEWYCLHNNICNKIDAFDDIISFITTGEGKNPVQFVGNVALYKALDIIGSYGSHTLIAYIGSDDSVNIIVSLFGIAIYNVQLLPKTIKECQNNCIFQELSLDSQRKKFVFKSIKELEDDFISLISSAQEIPKGVNNNGVKLNIAVLDDTSFVIKNMYLEGFNDMQNNIMCVSVPSPQTYELLKSRIFNVFQISALTLKGLKRFVHEHRVFWKESFKLNPNGGDKKNIFLYYILLITGISCFQSFKELIRYLKQKLGKSEIALTDELIKDFEQIILSTKNYQDAITDGADIIDTWEN